MTINELLDINESWLINKVADTFREVCEESMNGETAVNLKLTKTKNSLKISFDIDLGRGGIDSYYNSYVEFTNDSVRCMLGESLEGCGLEEEVEEALANLEYKIETFIVNEEEMEDFTSKGPWVIQDETYTFIEDKPSRDCDGECHNVVVQRKSDNKYFMFCWMLSRSENYYYEEKWSQVFRREVISVIYE